MKYYRNKISGGCFMWKKIEDNGQEWTLAWEGMGDDYGVDNDKEFWIKGGMAEERGQYEWEEVNDLVVLVCIGIDDLEYVEDMV